MSQISAREVKTLRDRTGAGMLACRDALTESDGDIEKAVDILRARGEAQAAKRAGAEAREGVVQSYVHAGGHVSARAGLGSSAGARARRACRAIPDRGGRIRQRASGAGASSARDR